MTSFPPSVIISGQDLYKSWQKCLDCFQDPKLTIVRPKGMEAKVVTLSTMRFSIQKSECWF